MCRKVIHRAQVTPVCYALCYPFKRQLKHFGTERASERLQIAEEKFEDTKEISRNRKLS